VLPVTSAALFLILLCGPSTAADEVPVEIAVEAPGKTAVRVELLVRKNVPTPRWIRADGGDLRGGGRVTLRAKPGRPALVVVRSDATRSYRLDGPFEWPRSAASRTFQGEMRRTLHGSDPAAADFDLRLIGAGSVEDPLCDTDGSSRWQCLGVPATFSGRIVACVGGKVVSAAEVRHGADDATSLRRISLAAAFRVEGPDSEPVNADARVVRPRSAGGVVFVVEASSPVTSLGDGILWVEGPTARDLTENAAGGDPFGIRPRDDSGESDPELSPGDRMIEVRAPGYATRRVAVEELPFLCGGPGRVQLQRALDLRGTVSGGDGEPVPSATILVRSEEPAKDPTIFGDATTTEDGGFAFHDLEARVYLVRACHAELGCREERAFPGEPFRLVLGEAVAFTGRVLSSAGVPEVAATVRIVPTADAWTTSPDRVRKLPLQTKSGSDGRFRIATPEAGDFLVEVRGPAGGVARTPVRHTDFSPRVTDLGDLRLVDPIEFTARVTGCDGGWLTFSGPLGGETPLPDVSRFRLGSSGAAAVQLAEPGAWMAWATCSGENERVEPSVLPDVSALAGGEVAFERAGRLSEDEGPRR
jgi:hypothetical protein